VRGSRATPGSQSKKCGVHGDVCRSCPGRGYHYDASGRDRARLSQTRLSDHFSSTCARPANGNVASGSNRPQARPDHRIVMSRFAHVQSSLPRPFCMEGAAQVSRARACPKVQKQAQCVNEIVLTSGDMGLLTGPHQMLFSEEGSLTILLSEGERPVLAPE